MPIDVRPRPVADLVDGDLIVRLARFAPADPARGWVPCYQFELVHAIAGDVMGSIHLRLGDSPFLRRFAGHVQYGVHERFRGHRYASRALRGLLPLARGHGFTSVWITCDPENVASRRTCELAGATLVEIADLPPDCDMYAEGERRKCSYRIEVG